MAASATPSRGAPEPPGGGDSREESGNPVTLHRRGGFLCSSVDRNGELGRAQGAAGGGGVIGEREAGGEIGSIWGGQDRRTSGNFCG